MNITVTFTLIALSLSGLFALTRQLQMLQQNSYFPSRYFKWVKEAYVLPLVIECFAYCIFDLLLSRKLYLPQLIFALMILDLRILSARRHQKKSIKKLVFTGRIKRFYAAGTAILALCFAMYLLFPQSITSEIFTVVLCSISFISPLFCLICRFITAPIDKAITNWYINDAKRILKEHKNLLVIGITGSYGKTTTKFILTKILSEKFNVVCTPQSFNTPLGVVKTIRNDIKPQTQIFVCEMGAKNKGDIKEIGDIANPDYGIITSVGAQHLETFKSIDNVFKTKFELADSVNKNGGKTFINAQSKEIVSRVNKDDASFIAYGAETSYFAKNIKYDRNGSSFDLILNDKCINVTTSLLGKHSVTDIVAAAAMAYKLGVSDDEIRFAIKNLKPTDHRLQLKSFINGSLLIDDAYNANLEGSLEAVRVLSEFKDMKKTIITPGLVELGEKEYEYNHALGLEAAKYCDIIILVGQNRAKPMLDAINSVNFNSDNVHVVSSFSEAMQFYSAIADKNSIVLLENDLPDNYLK